MEKFDYKKPAVTFLEKIDLIDKPSCMRAIQALIRFFQVNNLKLATCNDLLMLEASMVLKIERLSIKGYVQFCDELQETYGVSAEDSPFFKQYKNLKVAVQENQYIHKASLRANKQDKVKQERAIIRRNIEIVRKKVKGNMADEEKAKKLLIELEKLVL